MYRDIYLAPTQLGGITQHIALLPRNKKFKSIFCHEFHRFARIFL